MSACSRGANFERRVRVQLEAQGWLVVRAAGSRGPFELVALRSDGGGRTIVRLIQCKTRRHDFRPIDLEVVQRAAQHIGATSYWLAFRNQAHDVAFDTIPTLPKLVALADGRDQ